jgi:ABC-type transport system involved in multi-copper enzyme maturation permease subunit
MTRLLKSFFYKLLRDLTFRITMIVGLCLAVAMTIIMALVDKFGMSEAGFSHYMCTGSYALLSSISPVQNFGITIPINLIVFTTLQFTQGIIRNQVAVGNSKTKVYCSLLIGGLIFTLSLEIIYVGICVGLFSIVGGFYPQLSDGTLLSNFLTGENVLYILIIALMNYILISAYTIFIASSLRNTGPAISLSIIPLIILLMAPMLLSQVMFADFEGSAIQNIMMILDPFYSLGIVVSKSSSAMMSGSGITVSTNELISCIINNIVYTGVFVGLGLFVFNKQDIK